MKKKHVPRWDVEITYNTAGGPASVKHEINELFELHDIIEEGPTFCAIDRILVTYAYKDSEEAETQ
jgi:hypothetical protein